MTSRFLPLAAALAATLAIATPATAEVERSLQIAVKYDTAALGTATGAESVLESLQDQAGDACRYSVPVTGAARVDNVCVADIVAKAVAHIDDPSLTAAFAAETAPARFTVASAD
ncbi:MAG: UrcA family protein [Hyphomonas sp.]|nr:UrcA family protein [Hyphomonas sp.]